MDPFNPDNNYLQSKGIFGLPYNYNESALILIPVPWEVTCSYGDGTAKAPDAILKASYQLDLFDKELGEEWKKGIFMMHAPESIYDANAVQRRHAKSIIQYMENEDKPLSYRLLKLQSEVNEACTEMNKYVKDVSGKIHAEGKFTGLIGGDHSTALEHIKAVADREKNIGILQIDAHSDLREAYMGFTFSHASMMFNLAKEAAGISKVVQIGIRDFSKAEFEFSKSSPLFSTHYINDIRKAEFEGQSIEKIFKKIISTLPEKVYISFDIDGLDPSLCPSTGTPVPGGFSFYEMRFLLQLLLKGGKQIVGFDVCESGYNEENEWDSNVAVRIIYQLSIHMLKSNGNQN